jgi:glutamate synthase (NADPH/NADH) small chain
VRGVEFEKTTLAANGWLEGTGDTFVLDADVVFKAIGQKLVWKRPQGAAEIVEFQQDRIAVDEEKRTSLSGVWAGGDCIHGGTDLTVSAVQDGKVAALSIDRFLRTAQSPARVSQRGS